MKKLCFGLLACGAMLTPAFADEEAAPVVEEQVIELTVEKEIEVADAEVTTLEVTTLEVREACEHHEHGEECLDRCLADDSQIVTFGVEAEGNLADNNEVLMTTTSVGDNHRNLTGESLGVSLGVNQLADEQRNSLRLFSGREEKSGVKGLFARTDAKTSTTVTVADKQLAKKKAEIDQMRDKALKTGDVKLLAKADAQAAKLNGAKVKQKSLFSFGAKK